MVSVNKIALVLALALLPSAAASPRWLRHAAAIAVCAAEGMDTATSFYAAAQFKHPYETSAALRGPGGGPSPWRFALIKGGMCGAAIWMARGKGLRGDVGVVLAFPMAIQPTMGVAKNLRAIGEAR
jgi:hypothetical protein